MPGPGHVARSASQNSILEIVEHAISTARRTSSYRHSKIHTNGDKMADKHPFEVGVILWLDQPARTVAELAKGAEEAGFAEAWLPDHYFLRDVFVSMAAIAQCTQRIRLGTAVAAVQLRHPTRRSTSCRMAE